VSEVSFDFSLSLQDHESIGNTKIDRSDVYRLLSVLSKALKIDLYIEGQTDVSNAVIKLPSG
jgi:hypothetical protein